MADNEGHNFSPNKAIDAAIKEMLPHFSTGSQSRMRKAILSAKAAAEKYRDENTDSGARQHCDGKFRDHGEVN